MTTAENRDPLPSALDAEFVMAHASEPTILASGRFDLIREGRMVGGVEGTLILEWYPKLAIRCRGITDADLAEVWSAAALEVHSPQIDFSADAVVTSLPLFPPREIVATLNSGENPRVSAAETVGFYLVNFPSYNGSLIRSGSGNQPYLARDRLSMARADLTCTIDRISQAGHSERRREGHGYLITHVGEIRREDRPIPPDEIRMLLEMLYWLFAFLRGARTGPILPSTGLPFVDNWISIAPWKVDEPRQVKSWLPQLSSVRLDSLFGGFFEKWNDRIWREGLRNTLAWYVVANAPNIPSEAKILLCQIALETLASLYGSRRGHAPGRLREFLRDMMISVTVPERFPALAKFVGNRSGFDMPSCLTYLRNALEHPTRSNIDELGDVEGMVRLEAAHYGLELLELSLLALCGYRGKYAQRTLQGSKGDLEVLVPWAKREGE